VGEGACELQRGQLRFLFWLASALFAGGAILGQRWDAIGAWRDRKRSSRFDGKCFLAQPFGHENLPTVSEQT
jgi:hypothetical protein